MAKRQASKNLFEQPNIFKRQKTFDPYRLIESFERLSIDPKLSHITRATCSSSTISKFAKVRNDRDSKLIKWNKIPQVKDEFLRNLDMALETLKLSLLKLHCCKPQDVDINQLFSTVFAILSRLKVMTHGTFTDIEHFVIREFPYKQTQMFSEQYHNNMDMKKSNNFITSRGTILLENKAICYREKYIIARQIIECIAQIASASKEFSEWMLTQNLDLDLPFTLSSPMKQTMIDFICGITKTIIKDNRYISMNFGLVVALTHLLQSLTSHYNKYSDAEDIEIGLENMFTMILQLATFDIEIMLCLSESFVNITKDPNRMTFFKNMCISYPISNLEYSSYFRLMRMDLCGCKFQIFFLLLNHVIRFHEAEKVTGNRLDALIQITENLNFLAFLLLANDVDIKFLVPCESSSHIEQSACYCYRFLLYSTLILNAIVLRNQNSNPNYYDTLFALRNDSVIIINSLLNYSYDNSVFWEIIPPQLIMNEIFAILSFENLDFYNDSRTRVHPDKRKIFELYILKNAIKPDEPMNPFEFFLEKFDPKNFKLPEMKLYEDDNNNYTRRKFVKHSKYPAIKQMSKEDLLNELADDFKEDEFSVFSINLSDKDKK